VTRRNQSTSHFITSKIIYESQKHKGRFPKKVLCILIGDWSKISQFANLQKFVSGLIFLKTNWWENKDDISLWVVSGKSLKFTRFKTQRLSWHKNRIMSLSLEQLLFIKCCLIAYNYNTHLKYKILWTATRILSALRNAKKRLKVT